MSTRVLLRAVFVVVLASLTSTLGAEDYEQHVRHLAPNTAPDTIREAVRALREAGTNAFPTLLAHLGDKAPAERRIFQRDVLEHGTFHAATPTIGGVCFDLLQGQIEGNWPKGFRHYYVLTAATARDWLARHRGLSLQQLRIEAARQSLRRAEADTPKTGETRFHKETLDFLRKNLDDAKRNAA